MTSNDTARRLHGQRCSIAAYERCEGAITRRRGQGWVRRRRGRAARSSASGLRASPPRWSSSPSCANLLLLAWTLLQRRKARLEGQGVSCYVRSSDDVRVLRKGGGDED